MAQLKIEVGKVYFNGWLKRVTIESRVGDLYSGINPIGERLGYNSDGKYRYRLSNETTKHDLLEEVKDTE